MRRTRHRQLRSAWLTLALSLTGVSAQTQTGAPAGNYRISGHVVNAETGAPLAGAEVAIVPVPATPVSYQEDGPTPPQRGALRGPRRAGPPAALQAVITGEDGGFAFSQLAAAKYRLTGSRRGFIESSYEGHGPFSSAIVTGEGLTSEGLVLRLAPGGTIRGAATDGAGDPIEEASVSLFRLGDDGLGSIHLYRSIITDDLGQYEFAHLAPGTYFVSASARVWYAERSVQNGEGAAPLVAPGANLDVLYPRSYYADTTDFHAATPLVLHSGDHIRADLHLIAVAAAHLTIPVRSEGEGDDGPRVMVPNISLPAVFDDRDPAPTFGAGMITISEKSGRQVASISVPPGEYDVEMEGSTLHVNAGGGDLELHPEAGAPSIEVSGKLGAAPGSALYDPMSVTLVPVGGSRSRAVGAQAAKDGSFIVERVMPGAYTVQVFGRGRPVSVTQMEASGAEVVGRVLTVGARPVSMAALVAPASSVVLGIAEEDGKPVAGGMAVLVPEHTEDHLLFRRDQADSDGSFVLRDVAPGRYTVVVIRGGWDLDWAKPEVIAPYLRAGVPVTVTDGDGKSVHLAKPAAVQPR